MRHLKTAAVALTALLAACGQQPAEEEAAAPAPEAEASLEEALQAPADIAAADYVFFGGAIHTVDPARPKAEAVAVSGDEIVFVGPRAGAEVWVGPETRLVDLNGGALYPGFTDSHIHVLGVGARERTLNLEGAASIEDLKARVAFTASTQPEGSVVSGRGWIETHWPEGRFPTRQDLDEVAPNHLVVLVRADGHALVANSAALAAAGITRDSVAPDGGDILFDEAGEPTGMLIDTAMAPASALVGALEGQDRADTYALGGQVMAEYGWTGAHDMSVPYSDVDMIENLAEAGRLRVRVYVSVNPDGYEALAQEAPRVAADGRVITRAVKLYMDGALGSRGAALMAPYADAPGTSGLTIAEEGETLPIFSDALRTGVQMNVHAIGDRGNRLLLDWVERSLAEVPAAERALPEHRWRDEHTQIVNPSDFDRLAELGVIASMQTSHAIGDLHFAPARLGPDRLDGAYAWRSLLDSGARLTGGSDAPVERGDPRIEFYAAVARADLTGFQGEDWRPEEALSREETLQLFTIWPAYASFREDELGSIEVGKKADFTVFSADIMEIPHAEILEVDTWMTMVDGEPTYLAPDAFGASAE